MFDAEANGLLDEVTKMYCVVAQDYETEEMFLFHDFPEYDGVTGIDEEGNEFTLPVRDGSLKQGVLFIHKAKQLIAHNCIGYDFELMRRFYPKFKIRYNYPEVRDTLLESQVQWYDRPPVKGYKGIHGLEPWGARLGIRKPPITDWSFMDAAKLHRCLMDVEINTLVARELEKERENLLEHCGLDFTEALTTEHQYRYYCTKQELNGAAVDKKHMEECIVDLDKRLIKLKAAIEPTLPPTIKVKATKATSNEVAILLDAPRKPPIQYEMRVQEGEAKRFEIKSMYKPTMKYQTKKRGKKYWVELDGVRSSESFDKLKDAREWAKTEFEVTKGVKYPSEEVITVAYDQNCKNHFGEGLGTDFEVIGPHTKITFEDSVMSQHEKVKELLVGLGWKALEWTSKKNPEGGFERADMSGAVYWPKHPVNGYQLSASYKRGDKIPVTPQVTDESFVTLPEGMGETIKEYNALSHRRKFIQNPKDDTKGVLNNIREDGRVTCGLMSFGSSAGRASHYNIVNLPSVEATYGENMRKIITSPEGKVLVGFDMPSCHHRYLAERTGVQEYIDAVDGEEFNKDGVYIGKDLHTFNSVLFGLNTQEEVEEARETQDPALIAKLTKGRKMGKGLGFCCLYGGSAAKLAMMMNEPTARGEERKEDFLSGLGLDRVLKQLEPLWKKQKRGKGSYVSVIGGYHIWSNSKHKLVNYLALGSEAVLQKVAIIELSKAIEQSGLPAKLIASFHDECLLEVDESKVEELRPLAEQAYQVAATKLGLTLDWSTQAMVGKDYSVCH